MEEPAFFPEQNRAYDIVHRKGKHISCVVPHVHDATEIYLNLSFLPNVFLGNQVMAAEPGTLILIPLFQVHQLFDRTDEVYERYILSVSAEWLEHVFPQGNTKYEYLKSGGRPLLLSLSSVALEALRQSLEELLAFGDDFSFEAMACFFGCMEQIDCIVLTKEERKKGARISGVQQTVNDMICYLNEHSERCVTLAELSGQFYLNPDYISRIFKQHTGTTVGSYVTLRKIARARQLLREGALGGIRGARAFVTWNREAQYYSGSGWRGAWATEGGGVLINQSVHTLDLLLRWMGEPEVAEASMANHHLSGVMEVEDTVEAFLGFPGGQRACFYATTAYCADVPPLIELECERGRIRLEGEEVTVKPREGEQTVFWGKKARVLGKAYWGSGHAACISDFYRCLVEGTAYQNDLASTANTIRVMRRIYRAAVCRGDTCAAAGGMTGRDEGL